ncbi:MAG: plasmid pRiA4b ORF-3 family protein [Marinifilaceae bacterium]|jgi:hypothetical protein|nr:hypothetical protein [Marinilabiliaceae bacterium JC040]MCT4599277.1 plasmid pRiA4b ORF-3 family protein [Marinifilaceae bacterium]
MIYQLEITSKEKLDFYSKVEIKANQTFLQLHDCIQKSMNYDSTVITSFYSIDNNEVRGREVCLFDMSGENDDDDVYVMDVTEIREVISNLNDKLQYLFDFFDNRYLDINLVEIRNDDDKDEYPKCIEIKGEIPPQLLDDTMLNGMKTSEERFSADDYLNDPYLMDDEYGNESEVSFENIDDYDNLM